MRCIPWLLHRITRLVISVWRKPPKSADVPEAIAGEGTIVRAVFYPQHLNKGKGTRLTRHAFRPPYDRDEVSVVRKDYVDEQFCKDKAKDIDLGGRCRGEEKKEFRGFAVISTRIIRKFGSDVTDSRHVFVSHADIKHGFIVVRNEPLPSALNDRLDRLKDAAKFVPDPSPEKWGWIGPSLN